MPDEAAREESHHLVYPGHGVLQPVAEFLVLEFRHQRAAAPGASIVINHQDIVGCSADIKLGVLCAAGQRIHIAVVGDRLRIF